MSVTNSWLQKAQQGDSKAIRELLVPFERPIFQFVYRILGNRADAEDAVQECFYHAIRALPKYEDRGMFRAWLYQIARNEALGTIRRRSKNQVLETERGEELQDDTPGVVDQLARSERSKLLMECIESLPDAEREVVLLRLQRDITFREIAEITASSLNTVLGRMRNATLRLRKLMTH